MKTNIKLCLECKIKPHLVEYTYLTEEEKSRGEI